MYNPDEARDSQGRWTDSFEGSKAILEAASGNKHDYKNLTVTIDNKSKKLTQTEVNDHLKAAGIPDIEGTALISKLSNDKVRVDFKSQREDIVLKRLLDPETKEIHNEWFQIKNDSKAKGSGAHMFKKQVDEAKKQGYERIKTTASKLGSEYNGYYVWPRLGYEPDHANSRDEKIINEVITNFNKKNSTNVNSLRELMGTKTGQSYWKQNGVEFDAVFDLNDNSISLKTLNDYVNERGKK